MLTILFLFLVAGVMLAASLFLLPPSTGTMLLGVIGAATLLGCALRLGRGLLVLQRARAAGWRLPASQWALHGDDATRHYQGRMPSREECQAAPAWIDGAADIENLEVALRLLGGADHEDWARARMVVVYDSARPPLVEHAASLLLAEGLHASLDTGTSAGVLGMPLARAVLVPASEEAQARSLLAELLAPGDEGEDDPDPTDAAPAGEQP